MLVGYLDRWDVFHPGHDKAMVHVPTTSDAQQERRQQ